MIAPLKIDWWKFTPLVEPHVAFVLRFGVILVVDFRDFNADVAGVGSGIYRPSAATPCSFRV